MSPMAATTVSSKVRAAHRGRLFLVAIESSMVGLSAGITALAAAASVRVDPGDPQTKALLALVGILGALSWWMERSRDAASVARSIDRHSRAGGAVTTAFEIESIGDRSPVAAALVQSIAPAVSLRRFFSHEARSSAAVLAAPFFALALLAAVTEERRQPPGPSGTVSSGSTFSARSAGLQDRIRELASVPGLASQDTEALGALAKRAERVDPGGREFVNESLEALEAELADLARRIEAVRGPASGAGVASSEGNGTMGNPAPHIDRPSDGSMRDTSASNPSPRPDASAAPASGAEGGVGSPRWWPERYDGVVERWIEARRAAAAGRSR
ncbi:MAG: hypothetical protein ACKVXR_16720 [Planctomycetota bacterium]